MYRKKFSFICFIIVLAVFFTAGCGSRKDSSVSSESVQMTKSDTAAGIMEKAITESGIEETKADESYGGPGKQAEAFAEKIQEAVSDRSLEALAELVTYPCVFITGDQETIVFKKQEDLLKQNPDMVFGDDLMVAVANVDTAALKKTEEGIVMGEGGASRIVFKESAEGSIGITEIKE